MSTPSREIKLEQIVAINHHAAELYQQALNSNMTLQESQLLIKALEELCVLVEELRKQNDELIETHQIAEYRQHRYHHLFDFAPDGYIVTDLNGKIEEVNQAAISLLNVSEECIVGKLLVSFVPEETQQVFCSTLIQLPTLHRVEEWELLLVKHYCHTFHAALTVEAVQDPAGQITALRWLLRDISARKQAEAQLQQARLQNLELIEADRLKSQFMATLSHELRTPMNAILGFSSLLQQHLQRQQEGHLVDMAERITRNSIHMSMLVEEILDFSKLKAKSLELKPQPFDLVELANYTTEELRIFANQKAIDLQVYASQPELLIVNDRDRVQQILINLLSNAIKFTEVGNVLLKIEAAPDQVMISVSDTGIGIDLVDQAHIFKEFWQVNQSTSRRHSGTGLGLTIVHNLVTLMQGSISVQSRPGRGATFQVTLPRQL